MKLLVRLILPGAICFFLECAEAAATRNWITLDNCRLVENASNDGDSFHVAHESNEYIFRLYFVDAPETSDEFRDRVEEQAKYFAVTPKRVLEIGDAAKNFADETLIKPFKVHTCMQGAPGQSAMPRFYAFVETRTGDLGEQLVANGLARATGKKWQVRKVWRIRKWNRNDSGNSSGKRKRSGLVDGATGKNRCFLASDVGCMCRSRIGSID